jgi:CrcB protein
LIRNFALVMLGGALGSAARYAVAVFAEKQLPASFPWGTFFVNVVGSALLGAILATALAERPSLSAEARLFLGTGVMGGFTTYSTFNAEVLRALQAGSPAKGALYVAATLVSCLAGAWAGFTATRP